MLRIPRFCADFTNFGESLSLIVFSPPASTSTREKRATVCDSAAAARAAFESVDVLIFRLPLSRHSSLAGQLSGSESTGTDDAFALEPELGMLTVRVGLAPGRQRAARLLGRIDHRRGRRRGGRRNGDAGAGQRDARRADRRHG